MTYILDCYALKAANGCTAKHFKHWLVTLNFAPDENVRVPITLLIFKNLNNCAISALIQEVPCNFEEKVWHTCPIVILKMRKAEVVALQRN